MSLKFLLRNSIVRFRSRDLFNSTQTSRQPYGKTQDFHYVTKHTTCEAVFPTLLYMFTECDIAAPCK